MKQATSKISRSCRKRQSWRLAGLGLLRRDCGQSLVELALVVPIFSVLLAGAADFARLAYAGIEVSSGARAGVQYGAQNRITALDIAGMKKAATNDASDVPSLVATASNSCVCSNGTTITCANATTTCVAPARTIQYVQVNTSAAVSTLFQFPGVPATYTLQGQATMRVEQ